MSVLGVRTMFHLTVWDSFLLVYVVTVGAWLISRDIRERRAEKKANLEGRVTDLQKQVASLSGQLQRMSSQPPPPPMSSPVVVIPRSSGSLPAAPLSRSDDESYWTDEPTNPKMVAVEIVDDSGEVEVPATLRSFVPAAE